MSDESNLTVIIPAFNEADNLAIVLPPVIDLCNRNGWKLILVDDGSQDHTRELFHSFFHPSSVSVVPGDRFIFIRHKLNRGYGAAIKSGIEACTTEFCLTFDADGQHRIDDIGRLFNCLQNQDADMVVGMRSGLYPSSFSRRIGRNSIRILAKMLMNVPVKDINSGMKVYRVDLAKKYLRLLPDTMSFSDVITLIFINNRHLVIEEPITISPRQSGKSTIRVETAFQTVMEIINIVMLFNPAKIFLPLSLLFLIVGLAVGIPVLVAGHGVSTGSLLGISAGIFFFLLGLIAEQLSSLRKNK